MNADRRIQERIDKIWDTIQARLVEDNAALGRVGFRQIDLDEKTVEVLEWMMLRSSNDAIEQALILL